MLTLAEPGGSSVVCVPSGTETLQIELWGHTFHRPRRRHSLGTRIDAGECKISPLKVLARWPIEARSQWCDGGWCWVIDVPWTRTYQASRLQTLERVSVSAPQGFTSNIIGYLMKGLPRFLMSDETCDITLTHDHVFIAGSKDWCATHLKRDREPSGPA